MARAWRLSRLEPPAAPALPALVDQRSAQAKRPEACESCRAGHNSHWIPMGKATRDPDGDWAVVTRLHDAGFDVLLDDGAVLELRHHDMRGHGNALANQRRVRVQLQWGWLWSDTLGISVAAAERYKPCTP